jgi:CRP/FNR family transcriptional regulator, cyclic AMP receptor protein
VADRLSVEDLLARVPLFRGCEMPQLRQIEHLMTTITAPAGRVLTTEGEPGREFIIVLEGEVEVRHGDHVIATRGPGEFFGEIALLDDRPRTATVVAKTPVTMEVLNRAEFGSLLAEFPDLAAQIMATMAQRLAELEADE